MFIPFGNILLEWQTIMIFISIASMILGAVAAMIQKNIKRLENFDDILRRIHNRIKYNARLEKTYCFLIRFQRCYSLWELPVYKFAKTKRSERREGRKKERERERRREAVKAGGR